MAGVDWRELVKLAGPAIGGIASGGGPEGAAFMHAFSQTQQRIAQEQQQQAQQAQRDEDFGSNYALKAFEQLQGLTDPDDFAQALSVFEANAPKGMKPGALAGARFSDSKALVARQKKAQQKLDALVKVHGADVLDADVVVDFEGKKLPLQDLMKLSELVAQDPAGQPYKAPKKADANASTDYGRYLAKFAKDQGKTVDQLTGADELAARKAFNTVDDKPVDTGMRDMNLTLKQLQADALRARADAPPKGAGGETDTRKNMRIAAIQRSFDGAPIVKDFNTIASKASTIKSIVNAGIGGPGDLAIVFEFMKGLDPTSVVRETEYANAAKSGNIFKGAFARFNGYFKESGGFLSPEVKRDFLRVVNAKLSAQRAQYDNLAREKARQIELITGEPGTGRQYLTDYSGAFTDDGPSDGAPQAPAGWKYVPKAGGGWTAVEDK
jgi:hypothetical protein